MHKIFFEKSGGLLVIEELDKKVREYITYNRSTGTAVNTAIVISFAERIF